MGVMDRLKAVFNREPYIGSSIRMMEGSGWNGEKPWPFNYQLAVEQAKGWVYRCAFGNAEAAAAVPLRMYVRKRSARTLKMLGAKSGYVPYTFRPVSRKRMAWLNGDLQSRPSDAVCTKLAEFGDEFEEVTDHPALKLLRTVNPYTNGYDATVLRLVMQELTGNAYLHVIMGDNDAPKELWPMLSQWTWIIPGDQDGDQLIKGYAYGQQQDKRVVFQPDEVLHFKSGSTLDLMYGYGKVEAAWSVLGLHHSERVMQRSFFDNRARPDFLLSIEGAGKEEIDRAKGQVNSLLRGVRHAGKFLAVGSKAKLTPINFAPKDIGTTDDIVEEIAGVFGYPITKLKGNDPNRANAETGNAGWMRDTILPMLRRDEEALNQNGYLGLWGSGALLDEAVLAYDNPVPAEQKLELEESRTLVTVGLRTPDEDRALRNEEPLPDGLGAVPRFNGQRLDKIDEGAGQTADPFAGLFNRPAPDTDEAKAKALQPPDPGGCCGGQPLGKAKGPASHTLEDWPEETKRYRVKVEGLESDLQDTARDEEPTSPAIDIYQAVTQVMNQQIEALARSVGKGFRAKRNNDDEIAALIRGFDDSLAELLTDPIRSAAQAGGDAGLDRIGQGGVFDVSNPLVTEALESHTLQLASDINRVTADRIQSAVTAGVDQGLTTVQIMDRIRAEAPEITASRAERIARTESARGYVTGQQQAWQDSGVVQGKQWLLAPGACPVCQAVAKKVNSGPPISLEKPFFKKGEAITGTDGRAFKFDYMAVDGPPAHVNCLVEGTNVSAAGIAAHYKRWFEGEVVSIDSQGGGRLTVTPNHPILSRRGWIAAGDLKIGDDIFECADPSLLASVLNPYDHQVVTRAEDVAASLLMAGGMATRSVPTTAEAFHGDGVVDGEVDIVWAAGHLSDDVAAANQRTEHAPLCDRHRSGVFHPSLSSGDQFGIGTLDAPDGIMAGGGLPASLGGRHLGHAELHTAAASTVGQAHTLPPVSERAAVASEVISDLDARFPGHVSAVKVTHLGVSEYRGHVYNLQTEAGWYIAEGIITHNCRCDTIPVLKD